MDRQPGAEVMAASMERQMEAEDGGPIRHPEADELICRISDPERLEKRATKHHARAVVMQLLEQRRQVVADIATVENIDRDAGDGEVSDGLLGEYRFELAEINRAGWLLTKRARSVRKTDRAPVFPSRRL
jgi:hypothetical protein